MFAGETGSVRQRTSDVSASPSDQLGTASWAGGEVPPASRPVRRAKNAKRWGHNNYNQSTMIDA
ncbi:Hypothetical protein SMAX5B_015963 [Scophthalmus maximus]|uniref:Uncharacterized protein n=1 Tax=Scophthalmus maximus TaxID=52904 RepID=A0A2U9CS08_SCOMX|nr:Hypothetical protein SMAX5B_015963 [Scophthalmus maximus]